MKHQENRESNHILLTFNEQGIQSYIADIQWNIREYNDTWKGNALTIIYCWYWMKYKWVQWYMERKCIDIMLTLNETPGKQGKQGIQSYIADIQWNLSDYNDVWKGNALILW
jgi:hypothetical protein